MRHKKRTTITVMLILIAIMCPFAPGKGVLCTESASAATVNDHSNGLVNTRACYTQLNNYRRSVKKKALKRNSKLEKIAKIRAKEMAASGKFSHTRPNGRNALTMIKGNVYKGENIAMGQRTCREVSGAWYGSPGHRKNMLNKKYRKVGIAAYRYNGIIYWVQVFSS